MKADSDHEKTILITGGYGFIGSNFIEYFIQKYKKYRIINLDMLTYASNKNNLREIEKKHNYKFIKGDIGNRELVEDIFSEFDIDGVIHFAAESHVDNSISNPDIFIRTNIQGTFTLLDVAKKNWENVLHKYDYDASFHRFLHISTDEIYGSLGQEGSFTEKSLISPNSPYSASKAGSDLIVQSYHSTYDMNTVITNCSNNYGPRQHPEKLIPKIILNAIALKLIPIYGNGKNIRDWIYVLDHCRALDLVFHKGNAGERYNIGGRNERENIDIAYTICDVLDQIAPEYKNGSNIQQYRDLVKFVNDRRGHDYRYAIDPSKIENELGWTNEESFNSGLMKTITWYLENTLSE